MRIGQSRATNPTDLPVAGETIPTRDDHSVDSFDGEPAIVSISDIHGYSEPAHSALTTVGEVTQPVVTEDDDGDLHWADNDYVLLFNGDLIDRGDHNERVLETALRLKREAPPGRVRLHLGNHEMAALLPAVLHWPSTYSGRLSTDARARFLKWVLDGVWHVAFEGYDHTYSHAGSERPFDVERVNDRLKQCVEELVTGLEEDCFEEIQADVPDRYDTIFGLDGNGRGPDAGILWMDLSHMPRDAPRQVVGHSRQPHVTRKGNVVCQNTIRSNLRSPGGEAVVLETTDDIAFVARDDQGEAYVDEPRSL